MLPGRTVATQNSGWPFPLPMRVSGGRPVTDLSGKMRIQSLPLRFILRVSATRAASSCVLVIQARSRVCKPNSPKSILRLREAVPLRLPRWDFRYFTRFGINGITILLRLPQGPAVVGLMAVAARLIEPVLLPFYISNISPQFCRKPYWLRRTRSRLPSAAYAGELYLLDTIPTVKSPRHLGAPNNAAESPPRQNPSRFAPLFSSHGDKQCAAQFAARRSRRPTAHPAPVT